MNAISLPTRKAMQQWVQQIAAQLQRPTVILLSGDLGAGKTQLVRWFLEAFGVRDVTSPTFAIHHEYPSAKGSVDHVDLYRLKSDEDLEASGFWDLFGNPQGMVFVEWADRLPENVWPKSWQKLHVHLRDEGGERRGVEWHF